MNKSCVFKARLNVADLFHQRHHFEAFTAALHRRESLEHFVLKLLGFAALSYRSPACWSKEATKTLPDIWLEDESGHIEVAFLAEQYDIEWLFKQEKSWDKIILLQRSCEAWFAEYQNILEFHPRISVFSVNADFVDALVEELKNSVHWDILIEEGSLGVADGDYYFESPLTKLQ